VGSIREDKRSKTASELLALGDAFVLVMPGKNELQVCSVEVLADVFQRRDDICYARPTKMLGMLSHGRLGLGFLEQD
jgi:hypothetical protein